MSGRAWLLHQTTEVVGEPVIDAVHVVRHKPHHWPVVAALVAVGAALGSLVPTAPAFFIGAFALVGAGAGMNLRTQWRLLARTPSRLVLVDASPVDARPLTVAGQVAADDVRVVARRPLWAVVTIGGVRHTTARHHLAPLLRMVDASRGGIASAAGQASSHQSA